MATATQHGQIMGKRYRSNVAAILRRKDGRILIARRSDYPENWQFPQGGVGRGENPEDALRREVEEEIALPAAAYQISGRKEGYRYEFPGGPDKRGFHGQEQTYFLCLLDDGAEAQVDPARGCGEFTEIDWALPTAFPHHLVPPMKQAVYRRVLQDFFGPKGESR